MPTSAATGTKAAKADKPAASKPAAKKAPAKKSTKQDDDYKRALSRMGGIDPERVAACKTVKDLDALHLEARGHRIPGLNPVDNSDVSGNGTVQSTKADGSIVSYDASEDGWEDQVFEGTSKQVSADG